VIAIRVLIWNLFHGRSVPPAGRTLLAEFSDRLSGWEWDVALLQEVPPWWPAPLAAAAGAEQRTALTSRNGALSLRRAVAERWPDVIRSNGGGANAVLSRIGLDDHATLTLRRWPERRVAQLANVGTGICVANYHASTRPPLARDELLRLHAAAAEYAAGRPLVLGGDLNLRDPELPMELAAAGTVDFIFAEGLRPQRPAEVPSRRLLQSGRELRLSDHRPLIATLTS
jgi:endonuclease/exonuclease/phosphatase family metal-dependent hydrolase